MASEDTEARDSPSPISASLLKQHLSTSQWQFLSRWARAAIYSLSALVVGGVALSLLWPLATSTAATHTPAPLLPRLPGVTECASPSIPTVQFRQFTPYEARQCLSAQRVYLTGHSVIRGVFWAMQRFMSSDDATVDVRLLPNSTQAERDACSKDPGGTVCESLYPNLAFRWEMEFSSDWVVQTLAASTRPDYWVHMTGMHTVLEEAGWFELAKTQIPQMVTALKEYQRSGGRFIQALPPPVCVSRMWRLEVSQRANELHNHQVFWARNLLHTAMSAAGASVFDFWSYFAVNNRAELTGTRRMNDKWSVEGDVVDSWLYRLSEDGTRAAECPEFRDHVHPDDTTNTLIMHNLLTLICPHPDDDSTTTTQSWPFDHQFHDYYQQRLATNSCSPLLSW